MRQLPPLLPQKASCILKLATVEKQSGMSLLTIFLIQNGFLRLGSTKKDLLPHLSTPVI